MSDIDDDYGDDGLDDELDEDLDDGLNDGPDDDLDDGRDDGADDLLEEPDETELVDVEGDPVTEVELEAAEQAIPEVDEGSDDVVEVPVEDDDSQSDVEESSVGPTYTSDFREGYEMSGRGTNEQGNHWDTRDYVPDAPNQNSYHYSNSDGSYYYDNPDGSKYYNDGQGQAAYTNPGGVKDRRAG